MKALIDGDIVSFSCAAYNESKGFGWEETKEDIDNMIARIMETTQSDDMEIYISGQNNFRYGINPNYKANRKSKVDPEYRETANAYLVTDYAAKVTDGYEADDGIGIAASGISVDGRIICSIDKDLKMIEGRHFNWRKDEFDYVEPVDCLRSFYRQLLTGDTADHIRGVGGIGLVKSARAINHLQDENDMLDAVSAMYDYPERLLMNANCLWIMREEGIIWEKTTIGQKFAKQV